MSPWTDIFPLGQLQNQAYGYLFPHGLFFALFSWLPDWVTQRLWWGVLLFAAFAGVVKLLECAGVGSRSSRIIAAILYALSPRILATLGAISSEAWVVALVPWVLLPVVCAMRSAHASGVSVSGSVSVAEQRRYLRLMALTSASAVLVMGAVNAVATVIAVLPAVLWLVGSLFNSRERATAVRFAAWWVPAGIAACFWWVGPLLILGRYSPPFTNFIESSGLTTRWLNVMEVLRGATSWTPFLSSEREGGFAQVTEPVFIVATLIVALLGLWGLAQRSLPDARRWLLILLVGVLAMTLAVDPFSPFSSAYRDFLDGAGAPLRNLHKFDPLVRIALVAGIAHALRDLRWPGLNKQQWAQWRNPESHPAVVQCLATGLLIALVTATAWSGRIPPVDGFKQVPGYWQETADWLNTNAAGVGDAQHEVARTMILPQARFARQTWGNTRDEPAQPLLDVPWVVRDSVPLVQPEAIRALDSVQRELDVGQAVDTLSSTLWGQGVGQVVVRSDLTTTANTPGAKNVLRTLESSQGFEEAATFGDGEGGDGSQPAIRIFRVVPPNMPATGTAGDMRIIDRDNVETISAGPEALPRLAEADGALGRVGAPRTRTLASDEDEEHAVDTVTDTPALRDHNYGNVVDADSEILAEGDRSSLLNPVRNYPVTSANPADETHVRTNGRITASSSAADPTNFTGADTSSGLNAAVDGDVSTAWRPANGVVAGQWMELQLPAWNNRLQFEFETQGSPARVQVTSLYREGSSDPFSDSDTEEAVRTSTTVAADPGKPTGVKIPVGQANAVRITILSAFGDVGISEATIRDGKTGENITPKREIVVPEPSEGQPNAVNRWVFGQEISEGTMHRTFTMPERIGGLAADSKGATNVLLSAPNSAKKPSIITIDGVEHECGDTIRLQPGEHTLSTTARWAALSAAEPLYAEAVRNTSPAMPMQVNDGSYQLEASPNERIIFTPSDANDGRIGTVHTADGEVDLQPVTVNGWQQGWVVPAGVAGTFSAHFAATTFYQGWLVAGLILALLLVGTTVVSFRRQRRLLPLMRTERDAFNTARAAAHEHSTEGPSKTTRNLRIALLTTFGLGTILAARYPWGSPSYAGDFWLTTVAFAAALAAVLASHFRR